MGKGSAQLVFHRNKQNFVWFASLLYKTNRFHVAMRLFCSRSQMTSKCGKNKNVAHETIAESVTDVPTTLFYHFVSNDKAWLPVTSAMYISVTRFSRHGAQKLR